MRRRLRSLTPIVTVLTLTSLAASCGGDGDSNAGPTSLPPSDITSTAPSATTATTDADSVTTTSSAATIPETTERPSLYAGIEVTEAEPGSNPLLTWAPVDGATLYRVAVLDPDGDAYWAWSGADTSVFLGGNVQATTVGARVFGEMTWRVAAFDAEGNPLAISEPSALTP